MEPKNELQRNAIAEARRKELETYQRALDIQWLNSRMDDSRMGRHLARISQEAKMEKDFQERTDHAAIVNARTEKEIALGTEIAKQSQEVACQLLRRHYLREHDPALRELLKKLQAGYVCKDLRQQILDNEYRQLQRKAEEKQSNRTLESSFLSNTEAKEKEERERMEKKIKYCQEMQQQLVNKQMVKQCQYEEMLIEKKMLEDVMRTLADEDQRELKQKREQTVKLRNEMETFKKAREAWKMKQRELLVLEEKKIEEQKKAASDRDQAIVAERERILREREKLNERVVSKILADQASVREREEIIRMLREQEHLEMAIRQEEAERRGREVARRATAEALERQLEEAARARVQGEEEDRRYRDQMVSRLESMKKRDLEKELKSKQKQKQYAADLKRQIEENAKRRQKERELEQNRAKSVFDYGNAWDAEVAEERRKIVSEHAPSLLGYLQPGSLLPSDLAPDLAPGLAEMCQAKAGSSKAPPRRPKCNPQCRVLRQY